MVNQMVNIVSSKPKYYKIQKLENSGKVYCNYYLYKFILPRNCSSCVEIITKLIPHLFRIRLVVIYPTKFYTAQKHCSHRTSIHRFVTVPFSVFFHVYTSWRSIIRRSFFSQKVMQNTTCESNLLYIFWGKKNRRQENSETICQYAECIFHNTSCPAQPIIKDSLLS